jgi:tRNA (cmo5U34)-methyltransferase
MARRRFHGRRNIRFLVADYSWEPPNEHYDIIVSALSIHHLTHKDKKDLYQRVFGALHEEGVFVNAEQVRRESLWNHRYNIAYWDEFIRKAGLPPRELELILLRRDKYDRMETLSV